jgi:hypothetical protein
MGHGDGRGWDWIGLRCHADDGVGGQRKVGFFDACHGHREIEFHIALIP